MVTNLRGEWLGLIRGGLTPRDTGRTPDHDLGFAIPAREALWVADQLRAHKKVDRAYLGVRLDLRASGGPPGAVIEGIVDDTPADLGGLQSGDRIVTFDGRPIETSRELTDRLDRTLARTDVAIEYWRGPRRETRTVKTSSRPAAKPVVSSPPSKAEDPARVAARQALERVERLERRLKALERQDSAPTTASGSSEDAESSASRTSP
jgi:S1-C subfamily serine protease